VSNDVLQQCVWKIGIDAIIKGCELIDEWQNYRLFTSPSMTCIEICDSDGNRYLHDTYKYDSVQQVLSHFGDSREIKKIIKSLKIPSAISKLYKDARAAKKRQEQEID